MAGQQLPQPQQPFTDSQDRITRPWYAFLLTVQQWLGPLPSALSASTLLGRGASAAGSPEQITLGTGLSMTGTVLSSTGAGTVTHTGALSSGKSIVGNGGADITVSALTAQFVGSSSGTPAAASMSTARLLGRTTASSGAVEEITVGTGLSLSGGALTASGGTGGGRVLLGVYTASAAASLDCVTRTVGSGDLFQSDYNIYEVELMNLVPGTTATFARVRVSTNSGSTYDSGTNYNSNQIGWRAGGSALGGGGASQTQIALNLTTGNGMATTAARGGLSGAFMVYNPLSATVDKAFTGRVSDFEDTAAVYLATDFMGAYVSATPITNFQVLMNSGTITGTAYVYGLAK